MKLGNNLWEHAIFNQRLQPVEIGLGTSQGVSDKFKLNYDFGTTTNNGNVLSQTITILGGPTLVQNYTYDALNRLQTAQENNGVSWKQAFVYDRHGNRMVDPINTTASLIGHNPPIDSSSNRIASGQGYLYDAAGNMINEPSKSYQFDAENRLINFNNGAATYWYDGDGQRTKKVDGSGITIFVYNIDGKLVAEYTTAALQGGGTTYITSDLLGSPRILTREDGSVKARHDYLPFGEEIGIQFGGRSTGQGYVADNLRQKFTGQPRDFETGLDFYATRYYSGPLGRFTSADTFSGMVSDPQMLNLYSYALNNPLRFTDPTGQSAYGVTESEYDGTKEKEEEREKEKQIEVDHHIESNTIKATGDEPIISESIQVKAPATVIMSASMAEYVQRYGGWIRENSRDDGMVLDPTQSPLGRWLSPHYIDPTDFTEEDYYAMKQEMMEEMMTPSIGGVGRIGRLRGIIGPAGRASIKKFLEKRWDKATFGSVRKSIEYHVAKHGKGLSAVEYTQRAVKAYGDPKALAITVKDLQGRTALQVTSKEWGTGLFTPRGKIIWFHPKL